jgi:hypothetical protein
LSALAGGLTIQIDLDFEFIKKSKNVTGRVNKSRTGLQKKDIPLEALYRHFWRYPAYTNKLLYDVRIYKKVKAYGRIE